MTRILTFLMPFFLISCGGNDAEEQTRRLAARMQPAESQLAVAVWEQVNHYRSSHNDNEIPANRGLTALAQEHANYLSSTGGIVADKHHAFGSRAVRVYRDYNMEYVTEFTYLGEPNATAVLSAWMADDSYLSNLKSNWNHCGVGVAISPSGEAHVVMLTALKMAGDRRVGPQHSF